MGILGNLWLGKLQARGVPSWGVGLSITLVMIIIHTQIGTIDTDFPLLWNVIDSIYLGVFAWLLLFCGNRADHDLKYSKLAISSDNWAERTLSKKNAWIETGFALFVGVSIAGVAWLVETVDLQIERPIGTRLAISVRWVIDGALYIHLVSMVIRHRNWLNRYIDQKLKIDLLHIDDLSVLSSGFVTWVAVATTVVAMYLFSFVLIREPNAYELIRILAGAGIMLVIILFLFTPILRTRRKIITAKEKERNVATMGLQGTQVAAGQLTIATEQLHYTGTELLGYLAYLDSIWEWPVRRNIARLGFYALIPPVAWVLSALVEIALSGQLQ